MIRITNDVSNLSTFTLLTHNTLASNLARSEYYPHSDPSCLEFSYRSKLLEQEFQTFNADIICLQEIHEDDFQLWLTPSLRRLGYGEGSFAKRGGPKTHDGEVVFFKEDKFKLIMQHRLSYFDRAKTEFPSEATLATHNVALFCLLEILNNQNTNVTYESTQYIWICNTHLFWNHNLSATHFFQIRTLFTELNRLITETRTNSSPFIITGDMNSTHDSVAFHYITNGCLTETADYYCKLNEIFLPLFSNDQIKTKKYLTESHSYGKSLESAYNKDTFQLPFTACVRGKFCGTIDHIFYQRNHMRIVGLLNPLRSEDERTINDNFTLPNKAYPSDHLPLMAEFAILPINP